jgi:hypothetical protein
MKLNAPQSLKFSKLKRRLAIPHWQAVGILESLWLFTQVNAPAGDIGRHTDEDIAAGLEWAGDHSELIESLVQCGWLDRCEVHRIVVHDWEDHVPKYMKGALSKHGIEFASKQAANGTKQPANTVKQPAKPVEHPASILTNPNQANSNHTNPDGSASVGVGRRKVKTEENPLFSRFWQAYPRKDNRADAEKAFAKLNPSEEKLAEILEVIERQKAVGCLQPKTAADGRSVIPHASSWINKKRWDDELPGGSDQSIYPTFKDTDHEITPEEANAHRARQGLPPIVLSGTAGAA